MIEQIKKIYFRFIIYLVHVHVGCAPLTCLSKTKNMNTKINQCKQEND